MQLYKTHLEINENILIDLIRYHDWQVLSVHCPILVPCPWKLVMDSVTQSQFHALRQKIIGLEPNEMENSEWWIAFGLQPDAFLVETGPERSSSFPVKI